MTKEKQDIKLEKVDDKTAYENLLVKYAELENKIADIKANCDLAIEGRDVKIMELKQRIEKMKCCFSCKHYYSNWCGNPYCKLKGFQIGNRYVCKCNKWEIKDR